MIGSLLKRIVSLSLLKGRLRQAQPNKALSFLKSKFFAATRKKYEIEISITQPFPLVWQQSAFWYNPVLGYCKCHLPGRFLQFYPCSLQ